MARIKINYLAHLSTAAGNRTSETLDTEAKTIRQLVAWIDERSPGFGLLMVDPNTNDMADNNSVLLRRDGELSGKVHSLDTLIREGDTVTFW